MSLYGRPADRVFSHEILRQLVYVITMKLIRVRTELEHYVCTAVLGFGLEYYLNPNQNYLIADAESTCKHC